jgi:hypothetical protein
MRPRTASPHIVHVDQDWDYQVGVIAHDFATLVRTLRPDADYDHS